MSKTLDYIAQKFKVDLNQKSPIELPDVYREDMATLLHELGLKVGVEVGTWRGMHAQLICEYNKGATLYCVDPWVPYRGYIDYHTHHYPLAYRRAQKRLKDYHAVFVRKFSMDAVKDFEDNSLDFVYIDGNHDFRHVIEDIDSWRHKVKPDGIIYGHDYKRQNRRWRTNQVYYAVQAYAYANRINPWFILGVDDRVTAKGNGVRQWMWVK